MRYDDWDIILMPNSGRETPLKEFRVECHLVADREFVHGHASQPGLPVVTCFVPSLTAGAPFQISIHNWSVPEISLYSRTYSQHPELVEFEARVFIDGLLVAATHMPPTNTWPKVVSAGLDSSKIGEVDLLRFPDFRQELLYQRQWFPGDDTGRIKVILSEGFPRDSPTVPFQRIRNIVTFAFQHAPLNVLENNGIAWPSPKMWRTSRSEHLVTAAALHNKRTSQAWSATPVGMNLANIQTPTPGSRKAERNTDESMADAADLLTVGSAADAMHVSGASLEDDDYTAQSLATPNNTPVDGAADNFSRQGALADLSHCQIPADLANCLTQSMLNQQPDMTFRVTEAAMSPSASGAQAKKTDEQKPPFRRAPKLASVATSILASGQDIAAPAPDARSTFGRNITNAPQRDNILPQFKGMVKADTANTDLQTENLF